MKSATNLKKWVEIEYSKVEDDPWGLEWRPSQKFRYLHVLKSIDKHVVDKNMNISDIGCATGIFTNLISQFFKDTNPVVTGVDISSIAIERARNKYKNIEFVQSDIDDYSVENKNSNNVVICLETLYYIEPDKRSQAISKLFSLLKDDGLLVISSLNAKAPYISKSEIINLLYKHELLDVSIINLKPLIFFERLIIKFGRLLRLVGINNNYLQVLFSKVISMSMVNALSKLFYKVAGNYSISHILVIARK